MMQYENTKGTKNSAGIIGRRVKNTIKERPKISTIKNVHLNKTTKKIPLILSITLWSTCHLVAEAGLWPFNFTFVILQFRCGV